MTRHPSTRTRPLTIGTWLLALLGLTLVGSGAALHAPRRQAGLPARHPVAGRQPRRQILAEPGPLRHDGHRHAAATGTSTAASRSSTSTTAPTRCASLVFKVFLNIHKPGRRGAAARPRDYLTSGVHIDGFSGERHGRRPGPTTPIAFTNQRVRLPAPLMPHDSVQLAVDWHYEISLRSGREGMIDSTTWFLAYFYPRVAVYDDYNGWDTMDFTDQQEFYSDFNDYDVTIRVPRNYVVWGTGTLTNAADVLQPGDPPAASRRSMTSDTTVHVATRAEMAARAGHPAGLGQRLAFHRVQRARHGLQPERSLRLGCRQRGGGRRRPPAGRGAGRLQRFRGGLSLHGPVRPARARLAVPSLARRALPLREDHHRPGLRRTWNTP